MRNPRHVGLALTIIVIWGVNFVAIGTALEGFPPILLAALRFFCTALAAFVVPRPKNVSWHRIAAVGLSTFAGQYALLFTAMAHGMPEGLSSLVLQAQAPFTVVFAAIALGERTGTRQVAGIVLAGAGLTVIGAGRGGSVPLGVLLLAIGSAASWAVGNICTRKAKADNGFALLVWGSLWAAPPLFALSLATEGPHRIASSLTHPHAAALGGLAYVVVLSTFVGLGGWVMLLGRYPAGSVAPYTLGVPPVGMLAAFVAHGERVSGLELAGAVVVLAGLIAIVWSPPTVGRDPDRDRNGDPDHDRERRKAPETSVPPTKVGEAVSTT
jgi:O-acetylserine/cysteine efflux transporter